jgi:signal transduction histidine kinase
VRQGEERAMLSAPIIVVVGLLYLFLLFAIAYYGDKRADEGRSIIANPYIYALSIGVYATSWTFYGSVGRAATSGVGFLPIYLGLVTVVAVIGILPYISLQLKAITVSFSVLVQYPDVVMPAQSADMPVLQDTALWVAIIMAAFAILFGTRHIDASEHHQGMVAAIAFESVVKLLAFLTVGVLVTYGIYDGFGDIFARAAAEEALAALFVMDPASGYTNWVALTILSMAAIFVLPRQFQVIVVENVDERHVKKAVWLLPLYLVLINLFVLPIAFAGLLQFPKGAVDVDTFVLAVPMAAHYQGIALFAFIGGLSAATSMIIVETVALSTMVSNDLIMPILLKVGRLHLSQRQDLTGLLLLIRRATIIVVVLLGYAYVRLIGESYALVTIGLVSFVAAAQFGPAIFGGILWKGATRQGALAGLSAGFLVWLYTLLLPSFARSGWLPESFVEFGPAGLGLLKPYALFGLNGLDPISHALFWTMIANVGLYAAVSLLTSQSIIERSQANQFVDIFTRANTGERIWRGRATIRDLRRLLNRFIGEARAEAAFQRFERERGWHLDDSSRADADTVSFAERQLAGAIGAASARIMVASVLREEMHDIDEVMQILDEASQLIVYSRRLEEKSRELEETSRELRAANERLKELDKLKDDFVSTVSHELRTPLTSIRSFSEIVHDNPELPLEQRNDFLAIIVQESERLTRLINDILDLAKMEAGKTEWHMSRIAPRAVLERALAATRGLFGRDSRIRLETHLADDLPVVYVDADRLTQVIVNLISNAVKFSDKEQGSVRLEAFREEGGLRVNVRDNGIGIAKKDQRRIFERFQQAGNTLTEKPQGTGLGLPICLEIVKHFGGEIWVESDLGQGATFAFRIPPARVAEAEMVGGEDRVPAEAG